MVQVDPRDMLNNFCFHVYAQKSLFLGENGNGFFLTKLFISTRSSDITVNRAGSQLKIKIPMCASSNKVSDSHGRKF